MQPWDSERPEQPPVLTVPEQLEDPPEPTQPQPPDQEPRARAVGGKPEEAGPRPPPGDGAEEPTDAVQEMVELAGALDAQSSHLAWQLLEQEDLPRQYRLETTKMTFSQLYAPHLTFIFDDSASCRSNHYFVPDQDRQRLQASLDQANEKVRSQNFTVDLRDEVQRQQWRSLFEQALAPAVQAVRYHRLNTAHFKDPLKPFQLYDQHLKEASQYSAALFWRKNFIDWRTLIWCTHLEVPQELAVQRVFYRSQAWNHLQYSEEHSSWHAYYVGPQQETSTKVRYEPAQRKEGTLCLFNLKKLAKYLQTNHLEAAYKQELQQSTAAIKEAVEQKNQKGQRSVNIPSVVNFQVQLQDDLANENKPEAAVENNYDLHKAFSAKNPSQKTLEKMPERPARQARAKNTTTKRVRRTGLVVKPFFEGAQEQDHYVHWFSKVYRRELAVLGGGVAAEQKSKRIFKNNTWRVAPASKKQKVGLATTSKVLPLRSQEKNVLPSEIFKGYHEHLRGYKHALNADERQLPRYRRSKFRIWRLNLSYWQRAKLFEKRRLPRQRLQFLHYEAVLQDLSHSGRHWYKVFEECRLQLALVYQRSDTALIQQSRHVNVQLQASFHERQGQDPEDYGNQILPSAMQALELQELDLNFRLVMERAFMFIPCERSKKQKAFTLMRKNLEAEALRQDLEASIKIFDRLRINLPLKVYQFLDDELQEQNRLDEIQDDIDQVRHLLTQALEDTQPAPSQDLRWREEQYNRQELLELQREYRNQRPVISNLLDQHMNLAKLAQRQYLVAFNLYNNLRKGLRRDERRYVDFQKDYKLVVEPTPSAQIGRFLTKKLGWFDQLPEEHQLQEELRAEKGSKPHIGRFHIEDLVETRETLVDFLTQFFANLDPLTRAAFDHMLAMITAAGSLSERSLNHWYVCLGYQSQGEQQESSMSRFVMQSASAPQRNSHSQDQINECTCGTTNLQHGPHLNPEMVKLEMAQPSSHFREEDGHKNLSELAADMLIQEETAFPGGRGQLLLEEESPVLAAQEQQPRKRLLEAAEDLYSGEDQLNEVLQQRFHSRLPRNFRDENSQAASKAAQSTQDTLPSQFYNPAPHPNQRRGRSLELQLQLDCQLVNAAYARGVHQLGQAQKAVKLALRLKLAELGLVVPEELVLENIMKGTCNDVYDTGTALAQSAFATAANVPSAGTNHLRGALAMLVAMGWRTYYKATGARPGVKGPSEFMQEERVAFMGKLFAKNRQRQRDYQLALNLAVEEAEEQGWLERIREEDYGELLQEQFGVSRRFHRRLPVNEIFLKDFAQRNLDSGDPQLAEVLRDKKAKKPRLIMNAQFANWLLQADVQLQDEIKATLDLQLHQTGVHNKLSYLLGELPQQVNTADFKNCFYQVPVPERLRSAFGFEMEGQYYLWKFLPHGSKMGNFLVGIIGQFLTNVTDTLTLQTLSRQAPVGHEMQMEKQNKNSARKRCWKSDARTKALKQVIEMHSVYFEKPKNEDHPFPDLPELPDFDTADEALRLKQQELFNFETRHLSASGQPRTEEQVDQYYGIQSRRQLFLLVLKIMPARLLQPGVGQKKRQYLLSHSLFRQVITVDDMAVAGKTKLITNLYHACWVVHSLMAGMQIGLDKLQVKAEEHLKVSLLRSERALKDKDFVRQQGERFTGAGQQTLNFAGAEPVKQGPERVKSEVNKDLEKAAGATPPELQRQEGENQGGEDRGALKDSAQIEASKIPQNNQYRSLLPPRFPRTYRSNYFTTHYITFSAPHHFIETARSQILYVLQQDNLKNIATVMKHLKSRVAYLHSIRNDVLEDYRQLEATLRSVLLNIDARAYGRPRVLTKRLMRTWQLSRTYKASLPMVQAMNWQAPRAKDLNALEFASWKDCEARFYWTPAQLPSDPPENVVNSQGSLGRTKTTQVEEEQPARQFEGQYYEPQDFRLPRKLLPAEQEQVKKKLDNWIAQLKRPVHLDQRQFEKNCFTLCVDAGPHNIGIWLAREQVPEQVRTQNLNTYKASLMAEHLVIVFKVVMHFLAKDKEDYLRLYSWVGDLHPTALLDPHKSFKHEQFLSFAQFTQHAVLPQALREALAVAFVIIVFPKDVNLRIYTDSLVSIDLWENNSATDSFSRPRMLFIMLKKWCQQNRTAATYLSFVSGHDNPADFPSRWIIPMDLQMQWSMLVFQVAGGLKYGKDVNREFIVQMTQNYLLKPQPLPRTTLQQQRLGKLTDEKAAIGSKRVSFEDLAKACNDYKDKQEYLKSFLQEQNFMLREHYEGHDQELLNLEKVYNMAVEEGNLNYIFNSTLPLWTALEELQYYGFNVLDFLHQQSRIQKRISENYKDLDVARNLVNSNLKIWKESHYLYARTAEDYWNEGQAVFQTVAQMQYKKHCREWLLVQQVQAEQLLRDQQSEKQKENSEALESLNEDFIQEVVGDPALLEAPLPHFDCVSSEPTPQAFLRLDDVQGVELFYHQKGPGDLEANKYALAVIKAFATLLQLRDQHDRTKMKRDTLLQAAQLKLTALNALQHVSVEAIRKIIKVTVVSIKKRHEKRTYSQHLELVARTIFGAALLVLPERKQEVNYLEELGNKLAAKILQVISEVEQLDDQGVEHLFYCSALRQFCKAMTVAKVWNQLAWAQKSQEHFHLRVPFHRQVRVNFLAYVLDKYKTMAENNGRSLLAEQQRKIVLAERRTWHFYFGAITAEDPVLVLKNFEAKAEPPNTEPAPQKQQILNSETCFEDDQIIQNQAQGLQAASFGTLRQVRSERQTSKVGGDQGSHQIHLEPSPAPVLRQEPQLPREEVKEDQTMRSASQQQPLEDPRLSRRPSGTVAPGQPPQDPVEEQPLLATSGTLPAEAVQQEQAAANDEGQSCQPVPAVHVPWHKLKLDESAKSSQGQLPLFGNRTKNEKIGNEELALLLPPKGTEWLMHQYLAAVELDLRHHESEEEQRVRELHAPQWHLCRRNPELEVIEHARRYLDQVKVGTISSTMEYQSFVDKLTAALPLQDPENYLLKERFIEPEQQQPLAAAVQGEQPEDEEMLQADDEDSSSDSQSQTYHSQLLRQSVLELHRESQAPDSDMHGLSCLLDTTEYSAVSQGLTKGQSLLRHRDRDITALGDGRSGNREQNFP